MTKTELDTKVTNIRNHFATLHNIGDDWISGGAKAPTLKVCNMGIKLIDNIRNILSDNLIYDKILSGPLIRGGVCIELYSQDKDVFFELSECYHNSISIKVTIGKNDDSVSFHSDITRLLSDNLLRNILVNTDFRNILLIENLKSDILHRKQIITNLQETLRLKNIKLDALHHVWCDGGCESGLHRYNDEELTQEIVDAAVKNTKRLEIWFKNKQFKDEWNKMTPTEKNDWMKQATIREENKKNMENQIKEMEMISILNNSITELSKILRIEKVTDHDVLVGYRLTDKRDSTCCLLFASESMSSIRCGDRFIGNLNSDLKYITITP